MTTKIFKLNKIIIAFSLLCCLLFSLFVPTNIYAYADSGNNFDSTNVLDDLRSSTIENTPFNINNYPFDSTGLVKQPSVLNFVEYCYSFRANMQDNYGLYVYFYNPQALEIDTSSKSNKLQMAVSYDSDGNPTNYEKYDLQFCSMSTEPNYYRLFYKFKVVDKTGKDGKTILQRASSNELRYDVSGVELATKGSPNATEYNVGGSYRFTGYAKGYGADIFAESTLACEVQYLETIELDVKHTFYRTQTSVKGAGYQNQLDTAYFAVPKRFFEEYGTLQRIKAEWYEYKTNDIVVTSSSDFYNKVLPYLGVQTGTIDQWGMPAYNSDIYYSLGQDAGSASDMNIAKWGYNLGSGYLHPAALALYYLFKVDNIDSYDPYADIVESGGVESNALYEYIRNYNKTFANGTLPIKDGTISADLFASDIDDYRKLDTEYGKIQQGYSYYDFDAGVDLQKLTSWQEGNPSFWDNWINWGLWSAMTGNIPNETSRTVSPIYALKDSDLNGTNAEISERLLVNSNDVASLKSFHNTAKNDDMVVVLFRFATSDYYSAPVDIIELGKGFLWSDKFTSGQAYRAWESVFFDFDIIQLSFQKDGVYTVIPVVSSPIDIVNGITPPVNMPKDGLSWWQILLIVLAVILVLILLAPLLPTIISFIIKIVWWILKGIVWLIAAPFKLIGKLFKKRGSG